MNALVIYDSLYGNTEKIARAIGDGLIACGAGAIELVQVQRGGKAAMSFADFARGARLAAGARLG